MIETIQDLTREFFKERFPYKDIEIEIDYLNEWNERIKYALIWGLDRLSGIADNESMKILEKLFEEFKHDRD